MKKILSISTLVLSLALTSSVNADVLKLKDGQSLSGTLVSRDASGVVFEVAGQQLTFKSENIAGISFGEAVSNAEKSPSVKAEEATKTTKTTEAKESKNVVAPAGTRVIARTHTSINSRQHKAGHKFTARLEADMVVDGVVIAPRGSTLYGLVNAASKSGRLLGKSTVELEFTDIMINNQMLAIATTGVKAVTEGTGKKTVGTTARTAAIGGLINGSKGAKDGAKVGLGVSILTSGNSVNIPAGTMLEFQLTAPFSVK